MKMTKFGDKNGENPKESRYKKKQERKKEGNKDIKHASCFWRKRKKNLDTMKQRISNKAHNSIFWREEYLKKNISYLGSGHAWLACKISLCKNNKLQNLPTEWMALNNIFTYFKMSPCYTHLFILFRLRIMAKTTSTTRNSTTVMITKFRIRWLAKKTCKIIIKHGINDNKEQNLQLSRVIFYREWQGSGYRYTVIYSVRCVTETGCRHAAV